ncbi:MAG: DUF262 domain-containing HNH endonuclease family protein [Synergistaceae bacterium]|nr:DUF262 domain-containing HNH endonuclease family protein [Synergistaceae bacterium]
MEAIQATPQTIQEVFTKSYLIPDYQRPYLWKKEQCEMLWLDLYDFADTDSGQNERYFLGNIVLYEEDGCYCVVDGQQRLITLTLLMRAIFDKVRTYDKLQRCLFEFDDETGKNTGVMKITSQVIGEERDWLERVLIFNQADGDNHYANNYRLFKTLIENWLSTADNTALKSFIATLLNRVMLLPIKCGALDHALTIFETINNRGLNLEDTDIFKAKLHKNAASESKEFVSRWNLIEYPKEDIFRVYMHILRGREGITEKESAVRSFFIGYGQASRNSRFNDWRAVTNDIERVEACQYYYHCPMDPPDCDNCPRQTACEWLHVLCYYPNQYWQYPVYNYLFKHLGNDGTLTEEDSEDFSILLQETIRYCYIKSILYNSVNVIKDTIFKVCAEIWSGGDYATHYTDALKDDFKNINRALHDNKFERSVHGLCLLHVYLNKKQYPLHPLPEDIHVEHILPKKWNNYDSWTDETYKTDVNKLGNLVILEKKLNISAQNEFFSRKQRQYEKSSVIEANMLCQLEQWDKTALDKRNDRVIKELMKFFRADHYEARR